MSYTRSSFLIKELENLKTDGKLRVFKREYNDKFLLIKVPVLKKYAIQYKDLNLKEIEQLLHSEYNEIRLLAIFILVKQYSAKKSSRDMIMNFYLDNLIYINNWNLTDSSSYFIIGRNIYDNNFNNIDILFKLMKDKNFWIRRIAIISTLYFIRKKIYNYTFDIIKILINDKEDMVQKAIGWMLREISKKDKNILIDFLQKNNLSSTALSRAIEKFTKEEKNILKKYKNNS